MKLRPLLAGLTVAIALPASGSVLKYAAVLDGVSEEPPNASPGTGAGLVTVDLGLVDTLRVEVSFSGLQGTVTTAHIHCCTVAAGGGVAGVATPIPTFPGFPTGVTAGSYDETFDLSMPSSYNPAFVTANGSVAAAMDALLLGLDSGKAYLNIHTTLFPGGEIRGFLQQVPAPATFALLLPGLGLVALARRRRVLAA